jgi:hypothetical protein
MGALDLRRILDSEIQNWRDSGQALEGAKRELADDFNSGCAPSWAKAALETWRDGLSEKEEAAIPYTNDQILNAVNVADYSSRYGEGRDDPDISIDDGALKDRSQPDLPNLPEAPALTDERKHEIIAALQKEFNSHAEDQAQEAEPPSHIADSVSEYQEEYWSSMDDSDKYDWADRHGELPEYPIEDEDEEEEEEEHEPLDINPTAQSALMKLVNSSNPKSLWAIADSSQGKQLLLGTSWSGVLNLKDKQAMDRFHAYVGK